MPPQVLDERGDLLSRTIGQPDRPVHERLRRFLSVQRAPTQRLDQFWRDLRAVQAEPLPQRLPNGRALLSRHHFFCFALGELIDREGGGHRRRHDPPQPSAQLAIPHGEQGFPYEGQAIKPPQRLHHDIRRDDMLSEVMQERMPRADEPRARAMPREHVAVIGTGNLAHEVAGLHDDGILIGVMMAP